MYQNSANVFKIRVVAFSRNATWVYPMTGVSDVVDQ